MTKKEVLESNRPLTQEELKRIDFDNYMTDEIMDMVVRGIIDEEDVNNFYANDFWKKDIV